MLLPIVSSPAIDIHNRVPYAEDYELSIERQFSKGTLLTVSYVGTQGHRLLSTLESNIGSQSLCLFLLNPALSPGKVNPNLAPGSPSCGPGGEDPGVGSPITLAAGVSAPGFPGVTSFATTRVLDGFNSPSSDSFQSNGYLPRLAILVTTLSRLTYAIQASDYRHYWATPTARRSTTPPGTASRSTP